MSDKVTVSETAANTLAINTNTTWIIISTIVVILIFVVGYMKSKSKNVIKNTKNKKGKITQQGTDENLIDNVDNEDGTINQK